VPEKETTRSTPSHDKPATTQEAQLAALNERNRELAGFQKEAVDGRETIAKLEAQLEQVTAERDAAKAEAATAASEAKSATAKSDASATEVEAAHNLAAAIKALS
jgi:TolA-binding protein